MSLAAPSSALAQHTADEWVQEHAAASARLARDPRGAVPLLRLWTQREWTEPQVVIDRLRSVGEDARYSQERRALARYLEAETRLRAGQTGEARAIVEQLGFITRWLVLGPFENEGRAAFGRAIGPEAGEWWRAPDPEHDYDGAERPVRWRPYPDIARLGYVALDTVARPSTNVCVFAHTTVNARAAGDALLWLGASGAIAADVNGTSVYRDEAVRVAFPDRVGVRVRLLAGRNRVRLKVCTDERELGFFARFTDMAGAPRADLAPDADPSVAPVLPHAAPATTAATGGRAARPARAPAAPPVQGDLARLRALSERPRPSADDLEAYARFVALTRSDDTNAPFAADVAARATEAGPSATRWLLLADLASDRNRRLDAIRRALALEPANPAAIYAMGHEARRGARAEEALPWLDRAIAADDALVAARIDRALVLDGLGLSAAAYASLDESAVRSPRSPALLNARASIAEHAQLFDAAAAHRVSLMRVRDDDPLLHELLAREARARGDRETLRRETERMLAVHPERLSSYVTSAELLEVAGQGEVALGVLARATELAPDEPSLWRARGELSVRLGHQEDGRGHLRRALSLSPQDRTVRQHVEALEPSVPRPDEALAEAPEVFLERRVRGPEQGVTHRIRGLQDLSVRTVFPNGLSSSFQQSVFQVLTEEGAQSARTFPVRFDQDTQRFELRAARVFRTDGSVDESATIQEYTLTGGASRMYFDSRAMVVTFPRLGPGDVVELRWRVDDVAQRNAFADYFGDLHPFQNESPRAQVRYVLRAPAGRTFYVHEPGLSNFTRNERTEAGTRVMDFLARDVPALAPEDHAPGGVERAAYLHISTYRTWQDVARWYWGLVGDQLQADDRVRRIVADATRGATSPRDRVRAVYNWVIRNTRYVALEFGIHGFLPYRVPDVCTRGFGDCKDKASTIVTMLRELGIDASIVLVRTRHSGRVDDTPASLAVFDHAIAYIPPMEGYPEGVFLDGTAQSHGMDELPMEDQGATALVINQRGEGRLTRIPVYRPEQNTANARSELTVDANGAATLRFTHDLRGPGAGPIRSALESEGTRVERIEGWLSPNYPGVHVSNVRTGDLRDVDAPAHFEYEAAVPRWATRQGGALLFAPLAPMNLTRDYGQRSTRASDVVLSGPGILDDRRTIRLPAGATVGELPAPVHIDSAWFALDLTIERQGNAVTAHRVFTVKADRVPAADYAAFRDVCQRIDDALGRRVTAQVPGGGAQ